MVSSVYSINTKNKHHLCRHSASLSCCQESTFYSSIRICNSWPRRLTCLWMKRLNFKRNKEGTEIHSACTVYFSELVVHEGCPVHNAVSKLIIAFHTAIILCTLHTLYIVYVYDFYCHFYIQANVCMYTCVCVCACVYVHMYIYTETCLT